MDDVKRVNGDWAVTVQEVRAFKGSLKELCSKLTECGKKSIEVTKDTKVDMDAEHL